MDGVSEVCLLPSAEKVVALLRDANNNVRTLVERALVNENFRGTLRSRDFQSFWEDQYKTLVRVAETQALITSDEVPIFYRFAIYYCNELGMQKAVKQYLEIIAREPYYSFHAQKILANQALLHNQFELASDYGKLAQEHHHTPGYLLHAVVEFQIGQELQDSDVVRALAYYESAYKHLLIAKDLEGYCPTRIQKAFGDAGIAMSNPWKLPTIQDLIDNVLSYVQVTLRAEQSAAEESRVIIEMYYPDTELTEDSGGTKRFCI